MSFEAINTVREAEERARQIKLEATQAAAEAIEELKSLRSKTDEKATQEAEALAATTKNREATMRTRAEARLDQAASLIVERIVNS